MVSNLNTPNRKGETMITKQQRTALRSLAQELPDLVYVGKGDVTPNVVKQVKDNLYAHELIKIKVQDNTSLSLDEIASELEKQCTCETVCTIGSKIVLYKHSEKPTNKSLEAIRNIMK